jgi:hypothetical protein
MCFTHSLCAYVLSPVCALRTHYVLMYSVSYAPSMCLVMHSVSYACLVMQSVMHSVCLCTRSVTWCIMYLISQCCAYAVSQYYASCSQNSTIYTYSTSCICSVYDLIQFRYLTKSYRLTIPSLYFCRYVI